MVHLSGGNHELYGNKGTTPSHHGDAVETSDPLALTPSSDDTSSFSSLQKSRSYNFGQGDGFSSLIFSFVPTPSPSNDETPIPTAEVITHITPMVRSFPSSTSEQKSGFEPGWVLVPTSSNGKGGDYNGGDIDFKEGWGYPPGVPTPDPALLNGGYYNGGYYNEAGQFHGGINGIGMNGPLNVELAPDVSSSSFISRGMRFRIVHNLIYFIIYLENRNGAYLQVSQPPIQRYCHKSAHRHKNGISQMVTQLQIPHSCQRDQVLRNSAKESREV
jgi:hypothetical protein